MLLKFTKSQNSFLSSFGRLVAGSSIGYILVLLVSPIITRIYTPEEFGRFSVFSSIVAIFSIIATLSFEFGILGASRRSLALRFSMAATFLAALILFMGLLIALSLTHFSVIDLLLSPLEIFLAFISCFIAILTNIFINTAIHSNNSAIAARGTFLNLSMRSFLQVGFGYLLGGLHSLIYGDLIGRLIGLIAVKPPPFRSALKSFFDYRNIIWKHIKSNTSYIIYLTPANAMETSLVWLFAPLFTIFYDPLIGGVVAIVQRLAFAPLTIINQSLGQVFHRYASKVYKKNPIQIIRNIIFISFSAFPLLVILMFIFWVYGEKFSILIFGSQWGDVGRVIFIFLPLYFIYFLSLITNRLLIVMSRTYIKLISSIINLIVLLGVLPLASALSLDWVSGMILLTACLSCSHLLVFIITLILVKNYSQSGSFILDHFFIRKF